MKKYLLLIILVSYYWVASAQILGEPATVQSPNAAAMSIFRDNPVSLYTGLSSIYIPLYNIKEGNINIPISLEYHASGFRPEVHPGWVGMGWNLKAGGIITRSVNGLPDELNPTNAASGQYARSGYYFHTDLLNRSNWSSIENVRSIAQVDYNPSGPSRPQFADSQPDEFSFDFEGYSGKFYLNSTGLWKVKCNRPITVKSYYYNSSSIFQAVPFPRPDESVRVEYGESYMFTGFVITTEDGTQYVFGGPTSAIEYEMGMFYQNSDPWVATAWHLSQIIHNDGRTIALNYEREDGEYTAQMYVSLSKLISSSLDTGTDSQSNLVSGTCSSEGGTRCKLSESYGGKLISPVYLSSIKTSNQTIYFDRAKSAELRYSRYAFDFRYNELNNQGVSERVFPFLRTPRFQEYPACLDKLQWRKLTGIRIISNSFSENAKEFSFLYNNDDPANTNSQNERLTLLKVSEQSNDGSVISPYEFAYNKYHSLPAYLTDQIDHWGFYNANFISQDTDIDYKNPNNSYYSHREASTDSSVYLSGMLTRITYPTRGYTNFVYEQHDFGKQLEEYRFNSPLISSTQKAGGVRIRKIASYTLNNQQPSLEKEYFYVNDYSSANSSAVLSSSGILGGRARYSYIGYRGRAFNRDNSLYSRSFFSTQSVLPASSNSQGSHIGYSTVIEKRSDGSYTEYKYSNFDTGNLDEAPLSILQNTVQGSRTLYSPYTSTSEERGKLLRETQFNSRGQKILQKDIEYVSLDKAAGYVPSIKGSNSKPCAPSLGDMIDEGAAFKFYTYSYLPVKVTEVLYDINGQNPVKTIKSTEYSSNTTTGYGLIASESSTDSKSQTVTTTYRYPFDLTFPVTPAPQSLSDPVASAVYAMTAKNMVGLPIEAITTRGGLVTEATVQTYRFAGPAQNRLLPFQSFRLEATKPLSQYTLTAYGSQANSPLNIAGGNSQMQLKATCTQYDATGNPLNLVKGGATNTSYVITGGVNSSYLWGYQNALLVAKVENAGPAEIFHSNFEEATGWDAALAYDNQRVRTGLKAGKLTSYNRGDQYHSFGTAPLTIALTAPKKFIFSGWVYSEGPTAQLWLFMYKAGETGYFTYYEYLAMEPTDLNKWVYLEKEIEVPADVVKLNYRLTNFYRSANATGGRTWFDDVRIHPAEAQMTTYTHQPGVGVTSVSDANNRSIRYEYDGLNRLGIVRDQDGNVLKQMEYHYQR